MQAPTKLLADRYRFKQGLELGAKSIAWIAVDEQTQSEVVASVLPTARVAALMGVVGLRHAHLASVLDVVGDPPADAVPGGAKARAAAVVVAELVRGKTLHQQLKEGAPMPSVAVTWWIGLCEALRTIHQAGGAHGAISPRSIVVAPNDREPAVLTQLLAPTSGAYCAPERLQGRGPSSADDVWALHAALFAALTASPPFKGDTKDQLVLSMASGRIQQLTDFGIYEPELQTLLERGLTADMARRRSEIAEVVSELEAWLTRSVRVAEHQPNPDDWDEQSETQVQADPVRLAALEMGEKRPAVAPVFSMPPVPVDDVPEGGDDEEEDATAIMHQPDMAQIDAAIQAARANAYPSYDDQTTVDQRPAPGPSEPPTSIMNRDDFLFPPAPRAPSFEAVRAPPPPMQPQAPMQLPAERPLSAFPPPISKPPPAGIDLAQVALSTDDVVVRKAGRGPLIVIFLILIVIAIAIGAAMFMNYRSAPVGRSAEATPVPSAPSGTAPSPAPSATTATGLESTAPAKGPTSLAEAVAAAPGGRAQCVAAHFASGSFKDSETFDFLCLPDDLRGINSQLHRRLVVAGVGKVTPGMREWSALGWYELAATAVVRASCCRGQDGAALTLPKTGGDCGQLADALREVTARPVAKEDVPKRAEIYDKAVACLFTQGIPRPYHYKRRPVSAERSAFEQFYQRALEQRRG